MKFQHTDYHIHSRPWSVDVAEDGPTFEDYITIAEENSLNICFLEHFELYYVETDKFNPFHNEGINGYLEQIDILKENYDFVLGGLEMEYYSDREIALMEFMDDYGKDLDFISGSIHEWINNYPITNREQLLKLIEKIPIKQVINEYFEVYNQMIASKIFQNVCHIDTIFRYINENDIKPPDDCDTSDERILNLGRECIKNKVQIEYNLSGTKFPIGKTFPSSNIVKTLIDEGAQFFVGSDSHSIEYFEKKIPEVKKAYEFINIIQRI